LVSQRFPPPAAPARTPELRIDFDGRFVRAFAVPRARFAQRSRRRARLTRRCRGCAFTARRADCTRRALMQASPPGACQPACVRRRSRVYEGRTEEVNLDWIGAIREIRTA